MNQQVKIKSMLKKQTLLEIMNLLQCEKTPSDNNTDKLITGNIMAFIVLINPSQSYKHGFLCQTELAKPHCHAAKHTLNSCTTSVQVS